MTLQRRDVTQEMGLSIKVKEICKIFDFHPQWRCGMLLTAKGNKKSQEAPVS